MSCVRHLLGSVFGFFLLCTVHEAMRWQVRGKATEARTNLGAIRTNLEADFLEEGHYPRLQTQPPLPTTEERGRRRPWGEMPCDPGCGRAHPERCERFECIGFKPSGPNVYYSYACESVTEGSISDFTCAAIADLDMDGEAGIFVYGTNHRGGDRIVAPLPEFARHYDCGPGVTKAKEIVDCRPGVH